ncbi:ParA family protein [Fulvimarina pelagi]|nr:ParA family protein [Fulvimarina pelagi]
MKVITTLARKGGCGKTSLIRALTSAALSNNQRCLVLDADPQLSFVRWANRLEIYRDDLTVQPIFAVEDLDSVLDAAHDSGTVDTVFIDTKGEAGPWADYVVEQSDHIVCPMVPTETDLDITADTFNYYCEARKRTEDPDGLPTFSVVLTRMPARPKKSQVLAARKAYERFPILDEMFLERSQHWDVDREGLLNELAETRESSPNPLMRPHARLYRDALHEAQTILKQLEAA